LLKQLVFLQPPAPEHAGSAAGLMMLESGVWAVHISQKFANLRAKGLNSPFYYSLTR
jgi:hypothetical protein